MQAAEPPAAFQPSISDDGRYVAYATYLRHPALCDWRGDYDVRYPCADIFRYDRLTNRNVLVSVSLTGTGGNGMSLWPWISGNGRYVAFGSTSTNLVRGDTRESCPADPFWWACPRIYVRDLQTNKTWRASQSSSGVAGDGDSWGPRVTNEGDVVFVSKAVNLAPGDPKTCDQEPGSMYGDSRCPDVYIHEISTGRTVRLSVADDGSQGYNPDIMNGGYYRGSEEPFVSNDGSTVVFFSDMRNLTPDGKAGTFVLDRVAHHLRWLSAGEPRALSSDGTHVLIMDRGVIRIRDTRTGASTQIVSSSASRPDQWGNGWVSDSGDSVIFSGPNGLVPTQNHCAANAYECSSVYRWTSASGHVVVAAIAPTGERFYGDVQGADSDSTGQIFVYWSGATRVGKTYYDSGAWCSDQGECNGYLGPTAGAVAEVYLRDLSANTVHSVHR